MLGITYIENNSDKINFSYLRVFEIQRGRLSKFSQLFKSNDKVIEMRERELQVKTSFSILTCRKKKRGCFTLSAILVR